MAGSSAWTRREFLGATLAGAAVAGVGPARAQSFVPPIGITRPIAEAALLKEAGVDYIEPGVGPTLIPDKPDADFEAVLAQLRALAVPVKACNVFIPGALKLVGEQANHDAAAAYAETALRRAGRVGIPIIVFGSDGARRVPDGFDKNRALEQFIAFGRRIAPAAAAAGVTLALEPLNRKECNLINSLAEGARIVDAVGHPAFRLHADVYHMLQEDEPPEEIVKAGARIVHAHVAQKGTRMAPLPGGSDFRPYFAAYKAIGYRGRLSIESSWPEGENAYARACAFVREQWSAA
jgi:sugar phosphate isomerase/epimerase